MRLEKHVDAAMFITVRKHISVVSFFYKLFNVLVFTNSTFLFVRHKNKNDGLRISSSFWTDVIHFWKAILMDLLPVWRKRYICIYPLPGVCARNIKELLEVQFDVF